LILTSRLNINIGLLQVFNIDKAVVPLIFFSCYTLVSLL
jgi:hypothetical protein